MANKLASVIVITHDRLEYTKHCLRSILEKTNYRPYELIVVDNYSTDGTVEYLTMLRTQRKIDQLILLDKNYGAGYAMNVGISRARGEYLIRSDNDMVYNRGWLSALVRALERIPKSLLQVAVFGDLVEDGRKGGFSQAKQINGVVLNEVLIGGCNMAFTRKAFEDLGPFTHEMFAEDGLYCAAAQRKGYIIGQINDATATHIDHPTCPLSKRYSEYAEYRYAVLSNLYNAGVPFLSDEDRMFFEQYSRNQEAGNDKRKR